MKRASSGFAVHLWDSQQWRNNGIFLNIKSSHNVFDFELKWKMQFNSIVFCVSVSHLFLFFFHFRSLKTGSSSRWCLIVSSYGCLHFHVWVEHSVLSLSLHHFMILASLSTRCSAKFLCEKIILCCHQILFV